MKCKMRIVYQSSVLESFKRGIAKTISHGGGGGEAARIA